MSNRNPEESATQPIGTVYFTGSAVANGQVNLEKTIRYLRGLEKALKFYIAKSSPETAKTNYSVEVRIRPGSLFTDIMQISGAIGLTGIVTVGVGAYAKTALEQLAKNDVGDKTTKDVTKNALTAMTTTMKIAKHRGSMMLSRTLKPEETKVIDANNIVLINSSGARLTVTKTELDLYRDTPRNEFRDMMALIDKDTQLYIGDKPIVKDNIPHDVISVDFMEKRIFDDRDEVVDNSLIFPELLQDDVVTLEGELTRGNGRTNTLGFSYSGRILKCIPHGSDSVKTVRDMLFGYVRIKARVDRRSTAKGSEAVLKKPILRIMEIDKIEEEEDYDEQATLL